MAKQPQSKGKCFYCGKSYAKGGMSKHLKACKKREESIATYEKKSRSKPSEIFYLVAEGYYAPYYWLHLEVPAKSTLADLDGFLRLIWLECCGHLSRFEIDGQSYSVYPMEEFDDRSMSYKLNRVLDIGTNLFYEYDFGSTTELRLRVVDKRQGKPCKGISVLARNLPPDIICQSCNEKPATLINIYADYDDNMWFCDKCADLNNNEEELEIYFLPNVNSPRVGVCAYEGALDEGLYAT